MMFALILWTSVVICAAYAQESKLVHIDQGPIIGYKVENADVFAFYNVPYATAPTGIHKFKAPLPPPTWTDTFEAVDKGIVCPQSSYRVPSTKIIQEDCLKAIIYVPDTTDTNLPVVVFIHGGAFQGGYGDSNKPIQLVNTKNIIAVTFNYRVGVHGFLCMGTEDIPGNAGMKDQIAMLRWVKRNIAKFGGNSEDVTIAGCSAGGASTDLLQLSKMTRGLFKKVIVLSGSNIGVFGVQVDPVAHAHDTAEKLNFNNTEDFNALEQFYKDASYDVLNSYSQNENKNSAVIFSPCIERDIGQEMFLDDSPVNIINSGDYAKYPMLYGFADREGEYRISFFDDWTNDMNKKFSDFLPYDLQFKNDRQRERVAKQVKEFYFGKGLIGKRHVLSYINYFTDAMFVYAMLRSVTMQVSNGNNALYLHQYSFVDDNTAILPYTDNERAATHCSESRVALDDTGTDITDSYRNIQLKMREVWINFIVTGDPTPDATSSSIPLWSPANATRSPVMSFATDGVKVVNSVIDERAQFWDRIYDKYHRPPIPPRVF